MMPKVSSQSVYAANPPREHDIYLFEEIEDVHVNSLHPQKVSNIDTYKQSISVNVIAELSFSDYTVKGHTTK